MINIGLVNEMALMCDRIGVNVWEVIQAAATKPFGFMPFYPGPGLGGHWHSRSIPFTFRGRPSRPESRPVSSSWPGTSTARCRTSWWDKVQNALNDCGKPVKGSRIHIGRRRLHKKDIDDLRESPALDVILLLQKRGAIISYSDPHVPTLKLDGLSLCSQDLAEAVSTTDCAVVITDHSAFDYADLAARAPLIVDTRNALKGREWGAHRAPVRAARYEEPLACARLGFARRTVCLPGSG